MEFLQIGVLLGRGKLRRRMKALKLLLTTREDDLGDWSCLSDLVRRALLKLIAMCYGRVHFKLLLSLSTKRESGFSSCKDRNSASASDRNP